MIKIVREFGYVITAEGVETTEQFSRLKELGCMTVQGYLFSKPASPEAISDLLKKGL
jgi:EAL domain-containing protein (putative c-di-GMP-specific phosphodiesterase class I)